MNELSYQITLILYNRTNVPKNVGGEDDTKNYKRTNVPRLYKRSNARRNIEIRLITVQTNYRT